MNLLIDLGNTRAKAAVYDRGVCVLQTAVGQPDAAWLEGLQARYDLRAAILSSTRGPADELWRMLSERIPGAVRFTPDTPVPIAIDYVSADGTFRGGTISPGVEIRFRALHDYTASLPLCSIPEEAAGADEPLQGRSTAEAVVRGVMHSVAFEIEGHIARMQAEKGDLCVIFTGGAAKFAV